ncbi:ATP-binding protein [Erythrobacter oryzae]|uniref:ATP-binding protein n=1 Tax=Erythrobacter oryzae TaxID=3019556 RepID=UPI0025564CA6|nr:AAA family ATPase [Erythrobacter sp. COR-2]
MTLRPADQFRFEVLACTTRLLEAMAPEQRAALVAALPGLTFYEAEARRRWPAAAMREIELAAIALAHPGWPLQRLDSLDLGSLGRLIPQLLLMAEEDTDLAQLFEPEGGFVSLGGLLAAVRLLDQQADAVDLLVALDELEARGLIVSVDPQAMRNRRRYRVEPLVAAALLGLRPRSESLRLVAADDLPDPAKWLPHREGDPLPAAMGRQWAAAQNCAVVIKGPGRNGRKTWAAMAARAAGKPLLVADPAMLGDPQRWRVASALAWLHDAVLLAEIDTAPGEMTEVREPACGAINLALVCTRSGAVRLPSGLAGSTVTLGLPSPAARMQHWQASSLTDGLPDLDRIVLTTGNIRRAGRDALAAAKLAGRTAPAPEDLRAALRGLRDARLETLATLLDASQDPDPLFLDHESEAEFFALVSRCRHREALGGDNEGVRALLSGPSGTGKTLAARHVARALDKDVYRIDLAATVNKYIGETEKALERALSAAEELDVVLLLDEGDALMAKRTDVTSSNDRYANLETNFLLQRIESFRGIILVTSNDADRIDRAFARRMDAVIGFAQPDEVRRLEILQRQLGEGHMASPALLDEIACRCALSGGQLRNVAQHARLLALDAGRAIGDGELRAAIGREYRKLGADCPLRRPLAAVG